MRELYDELKEKNSIARSARNAVGGKKKYLLPSDRLSASEIKKKNGEITVYEMKKPISWTKFKSYPKDIQKEYLQWFADEFDCSRGMICEVLDCGPQAFYGYTRGTELAGILKRMPTESGMWKFKEWLKQYRDESEIKDIPVPEEPKKKVVEQPTFFNTITTCEMSLEGKASEISQTLFNLFRDQKISINVVFVGSKEAVDANMA